MEHYKQKSLVCYYISNPKQECFQQSLEFAQFSVTAMQ